MLKKMPNESAKSIQLKLIADYNIDLPYHIVWNGKERALKTLYGEWDNSFTLLYNFKVEIELRSPGSVMDIHTKEDGGKIYFNRFFMALKPCIDGFKEGCRPYLSVDSTVLTGRWNGCLPSTTTLDGHNWMFPVAFGLFQSETEENWEWFMRQLRRSIGDVSPLAVSTDACKGLANAVKTIFPHAEQRECHAHLMLNLYKHFSGSVFRYMWTTAKAYKPHTYRFFMDKIIAECPQFDVYLEKHHNVLWMRSAFNPEIKCDCINNNLAETLNNWVKYSKDLPVHMLMDTIQGMLMRLIKVRREIVERLRGNILPAIIQQINQKSRGLEYLRVGESNSSRCEVRDLSQNGMRHVVNIDRRECSCLEWQHTGKTCAYALIFLVQKRTLPRLDQYVSEFFSLEKFKAAYAGAIEPCIDQSQWPEVQLPFKLCQPIVKRGRGRPKVSRFKNYMEKMGVPFSGRKKGKNKCRKCECIGHREAGCPLNGPKPRYDLIPSQFVMYYLGNIYIDMCSHI